MTRSSSTGRSVQLTFNSDTGANYTEHNLQGNGGTASAAGASGTSSIEAGFNATSSYSANVMGVSIIDIHDYTSTSKNKTVRAFAGADNNGGTTNERVRLYSGLWINTSAINSISLVCNSGNWTTESVFSLYGIKGA